MAHAVHPSSFVEPVPEANVPSGQIRAPVLASGQKSLVGQVAPEDVLLIPEVPQYMPGGQGMQSAMLDIPVRSR
ncbi:MAG: hypothetical protein P4L40_25830 [Terracidiphilus sp.]|nr:hypothetical protein [Terracidiphilus sp.]